MDKGALEIAKYQSPAENAQKDRVNPQKGQGYPASFKKVQGINGRLLCDIKKESKSGIPVIAVSRK